MKLNSKAFANRKQWYDGGFSIPEYDRTSMRIATQKEPMWVHFGAGNLFRAFPALCQHWLLNEGLSDRGIIVVDNSDMVEKIFRPHNELSLTVSLCGDGSIEKTVVGSIAESVRLLEDSKRVEEIFSKPSLQFVSFTITEKGYCLTDPSGNYKEDVAHDRAAGPQFCVSYMGRVAAMLHCRYRKGAAPIAMVSMDNCSHNGDKLKASILDFAKAWEENEVCESGFLSYIADEKRVSFPWSMIDKITPRPDAEVCKLLLESGFEDIEGIVTKRGTYVAPFVNAEKCQYLVIEDSFPNGRPPLEKAGVFFTDRKIVERAERMKVNTCLNPLHTALAVFGCLLEHTKISEEMKDEDLRRLVERIGYDEGLPVVDDPGIFSPKDFLEEVLQQRFTNPFLPDTPQRIACDTSQKIPVRFGETLKAYLTRELDLRNLKLIPFVFAGWCRYLLGIDDAGKAFEISPDPLLPMLRDTLAGVKLGSKPVPGLLKPILSNTDIFGIDLYATPFAAQIEKDFWTMVQAPGNVRKLLHSKVTEQ